MILGAQLPSPLRDQDPEWDPALGLRLAQQIACQNKPFFSLVRPLSPPHLSTMRMIFKATDRENQWRKMEERYLG